MNLRDSVELWEAGVDGEDAHGNPIPGTPTLLATVPAHVFYTQAGLEQADDYLRGVEQLRCIIPPQPFPIDPLVQWLVWRTETYRIDGVMPRSARGATHHLTLNIQRLASPPG